MLGLNDNAAQLDMEIEKHWKIINELWAQREKVREEKVQ